MRSICSSISDCFTRFQHSNGNVCVLCMPLCCGVSLCEIKLNASEIRRNEKWIDNEQHTWKTNMLFLWVFLFCLFLLLVSHWIAVSERTITTANEMEMANLLAWESHCNCALTVSYFSWCVFSSSMLMNLHDNKSLPSSNESPECMASNVLQAKQKINVPLISWSFLIPKNIIRDLI